MVILSCVIPTLSRVGMTLLVLLCATVALAKDIALPPPATVPSVLREVDPSIASDGHDYLAVWIRDGVRAARISASGEVSADFLISELNATTARVTWIGSAYLVVYGDSYALVSSSGDVATRDEKLPVTTQFLTGIAWNGRDLFLTWLEPGRVSTPVAALLDKNLQLIRDRIDIAPFAVVPTADGFVAFTTTPNGISATTFANDGTSGSENIVSANVASATAATDGHNIVLAWRDTAVHTMNFTTRTTNDVSGASGNLTLTGGRNGFLLSWIDNGIFGRRLDASGRPLDASPFPITSVAWLGAFRGASNGDSYFLIWSDGRRTPFTALDDVWGAQIGTSVREMPIVFSAANQFSPSAAFNGSVGVVAWGETATDYWSRVVAARFSADGSFLDATGIEIASAGSTPSVATDGRDFLIVWRGSNQHVNAALMRADGTLGAVQDVSNAASASPPSVAFDGNDYFVVWDDTAEFSRRSMHGARLNRSGQLIDTIFFNVGAGISPEIGFDGTGLWLVYLHPSISNLTVLLAQRVTPQGFLLGNAVLLDLTPVTPNAPAIACGNGKCLAAWNHQAPDTSDLYAAVLGSSGIDVPAFPIATAYQQLPPTVAFNGTGFVVTWGEWSDRYAIREPRVSSSGQRQGIFTVTSGVSFPSATPLGISTPAVIYAGTGPVSRLFLRTTVEESRHRAAAAD